MSVSPLTQDLPGRVEEAAAAIRRNAPQAPRLGIVLGSGLSGIAEAAEEAALIPIADLPHWPASTVASHAGRLAIGSWRGVPVAVLAGRSHRYEGHAPDRVTFAVRVMHALGARTLVLTNAVGAVNPRLSPGDLMLATDHINGIAKRGLFTPAENAERSLGRRVATIYDPALGGALREAALRAGVALRLGVLLGSLGPAYETAAEIRMAATAGADAVCMSTVHEALVAAHLGCRVASISCVANYATGRSGTRLTHEEVIEVAGLAAAKLRSVLEAWLDGGGI